MDQENTFGSKFLILYQQINGTKIYESLVGTEKAANSWRTHPITYAKFLRGCRTVDVRQFGRLILNPIITFFVVIVVI